MAALANPMLRDRLTQRGLVVHGTGAAGLAALMTTETAKWARVLEVSGIKGDR